MDNAAQTTSPRLSKVFNWDSYLGCLHPSLGDTLSQSPRAEADWNTNPNPKKIVVTHDRCQTTALKSCHPRRMAHGPTYLSHTSC